MLTQPQLERIKLLADSTTMSVLQIADEVRAPDCTSKTFWRSVQQRVRFHREMGR